MYKIPFYTIFVSILAVGCSTTAKKKNALEANDEAHVTAGHSCTPTNMRFTASNQPLSQMPCV